MKYIEFEPFSTIRVRDVARLAAVGAVGLVVIAGACVFCFVIGLNEKIRSE